MDSPLGVSPFRVSALPWMPDSVSLLVVCDVVLRRFSFDDWIRADSWIAVDCNRMIRDVPNRINRIRAINDESMHPMDAL